MNMNTETTSAMGGKFWEGKKDLNLSSLLNNFKNMFIFKVWDAVWNEDKNQSFVILSMFLEAISKNLTLDIFIWKVWQRQCISVSSKNKKPELLHTYLPRFSIIQCLQFYNGKKFINTSFLSHQTFLGFQRTIDFSVWVWSTSTKSF